MSERNEPEANMSIQSAVDSWHGKPRQAYKHRRRWMVPRWVGFAVLAVYAGLWVWAFWHVGPRG